MKNILKLSERFMNYVKGNDKQEKEFNETKCAIHQHATDIKDEDDKKLFYDYVYWPKEWFEKVVSYCRENKIDVPELINRAESEKQLLQEATSIIKSKDKEIERLKGLMYEVCVRANIIFPETEEALDWFDEQFKRHHDLLLNISATLGLGEIDEESVNANKEHLEKVRQQFQKENKL